MKRLIGAALSVAFASGLAACSDKGPSGPDDTATNAPSGMVVSNALLSSRSAASTGIQSSLSASAGSVAYVSAVPGTFREGVSVAIRNETTGGASRSVELIDGGFDPVGIDAVAGDELSLTVFISGAQLPPVMVTVPSRRPPAVVRTNPAKGRTDVALNIQVVVVFSEPVEPSSVTSSSFALRSGGNVVSGKVQVAADGLSAEFIPDSPLLPQTTYELAIDGAIRDLDGDALDASVVSFTTAGVPVFTAGVPVFTAGVYDLSAPITGFDPAWGDLTGYRYTGIITVTAPGVGGTFENSRRIGTFEDFRLIGPDSESSIPSPLSGVAATYIDFAGRVVIELVADSSAWSSSFHFTLVEPVRDTLDSRLIEGKFGCCGHIDGTFTAKRKQEE